LHVPRRASRSSGSRARGLRRRQSVQGFAGGLFAGRYQLSAVSTLSTIDIGALADAFSDHPFSGGQTAPLFAKWASDDTFVFLQFDKPLASAAKALAHLGVGVKGTFCAETRPDRAGASFTRFQRYQAAEWTRGGGASLPTRATG
jgi:hypothetical protein